MEIQADKDNIIDRVREDIAVHGRQGRTVDVEVVVRKFLKDDNVTMTDNEVRELVQDILNKQHGDRMRTAQAVQ